MAPTPFTDPDASRAPALDAAAGEVLAGVVAGSVYHGLRHGSHLPVLTEHYPPALRAQRASFVTLYTPDQLRGCIGSLEAHAPLVEDVARNAFGAAFQDPRFDPLSSDQLGELAATVSVLSEPEPLAVTSARQLLDVLRPGRDGLILELGERRTTFLPAVWATLSEPWAFVAALMEKAQLDPRQWPQGLRVSRYESHIVACNDLARHLPAG